MSCEPSFRGLDPSPGSAPGSSGRPGCRVAHGGTRDTHAAGQRGGPQRPRRTSAVAEARGYTPTREPTATGGRKAAGQRWAGPRGCADTQARDWVRRTQDAAAGNEKGKRGRGLGHPPRLRLPPEDARRIAPSHIEPGSGQCLVDIGVVARRQLGHRQGTLASVLGVRCAEAPLGIDRSPTGRVALGRWNVTLAMTEGRPAPVGWRGNTACER